MSVWQDWPYNDSAVFGPAANSRRTAGRSLDAVILDRTGSWRRTLVSRCIGPDGVLSDVGGKLGGVLSESGRGTATHRPRQQCGGVHEQRVANAPGRHRTVTQPMLDCWTSNDCIGTAGRFTAASVGVAGPDGTGIPRYARHHFYVDEASR
jgi:hypothetical protein